MEQIQDEATTEDMLALIARELWWISLAAKVAVGVGALVVAVWLAGMVAGAAAGLAG